MILAEALSDTATRFLHPTLLSDKCLIFCCVQPCLPPARWQNMAEATASFKRPTTISDAQEMRKNIPHTAAGEGGGGGGGHQCILWCGYL